VAAILLSNDQRAAACWLDGRTASGPVGKATRLIHTRTIGSGSGCEENTKLTVPEPGGFQTGIFTKR
jgi:hypothetical protein